MESFYLERPSMKRKDEIIEYLDEFVKYGSNINGSGSLDRIYDGYTFEEALDRCLKMENEEYAKTVNRCPGKTFLLIRENDNKIVGSINIRWNLNEAMLNFGGNIGYGIRPTERRKGYNKINLYLGMIEAKKVGLDKVMLDCDVNNLGSDKTLKALGGKLERTGINPSDGTLTNVYWFDVSETIEKYKDIYEQYIKKERERVIMNFKLNNDIEIPSIGLGTWLIDNNRVSETIKNAVKIGYRHIDTAQAYENEEGVGIGIKECGIDRKELFITSKVRAEYKDYESAKKSIDESLEKLGLDYIDLMIIHSPQPWAEFRITDNNYYTENIEVWRALEDAYNEGKIKAIGVSNFHVNDLKNIIENCRIKPMVNQVLAHIGQTPFEIIDYCKKEDVLVEAYSPIAHGEADRIQEVQEMAKKYNKSFAQICLKYDLNLGLVVLPKANSVEHLENNFDLNFEISDEDMELLKSVEPLKDYGQDDFFPVFKQSGK